MRALDIESKCSIRGKYPNLNAGKLVGMDALDSPAHVEQRVGFRARDNTLAALPGKCFRMEGPSATCDPPELILLFRSAGRSRK